MITILLKIIEQKLNITLGGDALVFAVITDIVVIIAMCNFLEKIGVL